MCVWRAFEISRIRLEPVVGNYGSCLISHYGHPK
jgi:hypothetical protein